MRAFTVTRKYGSVNGISARSTCLTHFQKMRGRCISGMVQRTGWFQFSCHGTLSRNSHGFSTTSCLLLAICSVFPMGWLIIYSRHSLKKIRIYHGFNSLLPLSLSRNCKNWYIWILISEFLVLIM
jgi:hypothetical protein